MMGRYLIHEHRHHQPKISLMRDVQPQDLACAVDIGHYMNRRTCMTRVWIIQRYASTALYVAFLT